MANRGHGNVKEACSLLIRRASQAHCASQGGKKKQILAERLGKTGRADCIESI